MKLPSLSIFDQFSNMITGQETLTHHFQTTCLAIIVMQFAIVIKFPAILLPLPSVQHNIVVAITTTATIGCITRIYDSAHHLKFVLALSVNTD